MWAYFQMIATEHERACNLTTPAAKVDLNVYLASMSKEGFLKYWAEWITDIDANQLQAAVTVSVQSPYSV